MTVWTRKDLDTFVKDNLPVEVDPILKGKKAPPTGITKDILWTFAINLLRMVDKQQDDRVKAKSEEGTVVEQDKSEQVLKELAAMRECFASIPDMIQKAINSKEKTDDIGKSVNPSPKKTPQKHTLKLEKVGLEQWKVVKAKVRKTLQSIPVDGTSSNEEDTNLVFKDKSQRDKAEELLKSDFDTSTATVTTKKLNPKVTITDIAGEITTADEVYQEILRKNEEIKEQVETHNEELKVIFLHKDDRYAVVQMSKKIREIVRKRNDRINLDFQIHAVKDRFHVVQCFKCQRFGHKSDSVMCPRRDSGDHVCTYCAGNHRFKECQLKKDRRVDSRCCTNCKSSRSKIDQLNATTHTANSFQCPFYIMEKERLMNRTAGAEMLKNEYSRKARDFLERRRTH